MTKEDDRTILNLHASAISQLMLLVYMSTWFDDTGDDGAGGDISAEYLPKIYHAAWLLQRMQG